MTLSSCYSLQRGSAFSQSLFLLLPVNRKACNASLCNVVMLSKLPKLPQMSSRWDMKRRRNCNPVCQVSLTLFPLRINSDSLIGLLIKRQSSVVGGLADGACETDSPSVTLQRQRQSCHPAHFLPLVLKQHHKMTSSRPRKGGGGEGPLLHTWACCQQTAQIPMRSLVR